MTEANMKKKLHTTILLLCVMPVVCGCGVQAESESKPETEEPVLRADETIQDSSADAWIGEYEFFEYIPASDENNYVAWPWSYSIRIYKKDKDCMAIMSNDGFQMVDRYRMRIVGDENEISFVFEEYLPGNMFEPFKKGDLLLRFVRSGDEIHTVWQEKQPNTEIEGQVVQFEQTVEKVTAERFKSQAVKFLKALREDNLKDFSQAVLDDSFYISRIFSRCKPGEERNEDVLSQKIRLKDIPSLDFPIGTENQPSDLNSRFCPTPESDSAYEALIAEAPMKEISIDDFYSVGKSKAEFIEQCDSLMKAYGLNFSDYAIICVAENDFVLVSFARSTLAYSDWAYFERVEDSFYLKSVLLFY
jgi:hypothetical protein